MQGQKKVLYVITKGEPFGGAQRYVYDLATSLPKDKFEVVVACGQGDLLIERLKEAKIKTIKIENLGRDIKLGDDFKVFRELIRIIKTEEPDIVHLNSSKAGLLGALAVLYLRIFQSFHLSIPKCIFTGHGWAFNENRSFLSKILILFLHWFTVLLCHTTIAVSEKAKRDIICLPFIKNKIKVVYNGISDFDPSAGGLSEEESRRILASKEINKIIIFSISELHKNKGIDVALKALSFLPKEIKEKIIYSVAGSGEEKENLEKLVKELQVENLTRFLGFVPNAQKLLPGADIFLLSSRTEAFPYCLLEAGIAGLPIIATSVGGVPEVIHDMQNGILVHPRNPKEIAEAILYLLDHKDKRTEFGEEIKKTVSNFFSLEKMLGEIIRLYQ